MQELLEKRNRALLRDIRGLRHLLASMQTSDVLMPYRRRVDDICLWLDAQVQRNLAYLALDQPDILPDVLSATRDVSRTVQLVDSRLGPPILRACAADDLCLTTIGWLHRGHPQTADYPPAFSDGAVATWPFLRFGTPLYFFPLVEQRSLLYQPLYFHEFGHVLYACHKQELDALVGDLQWTVGNLLVPASQRNDRHAARHAEQREAIVNTWYQWAQELFCDAVGFMIGGPCFLLAFSTYLNGLAEVDFHKPSADLRRSSHPVTWLRIQFLTRRAASSGFSNLANAIDDQWRMVAKGLQIHEDYHGFYIDAFEGPAERTVADMLVEVEPRQFTADEAGGTGWSPSSDSLIQLLNWAWQVYADQPETYDEWEGDKIRLLLHG